MNNWSDPKGMDLWNRMAGTEDAVLEKGGRIMTAYLCGIPWAECL